MTPEAILQLLKQRLPGLRPKASWGETALFYNPGDALPNGVYFCTLKEADGENDQASRLDRAGVFRLAIGLAPQSYARLFGSKPARPAKGGTVATGHDFTRLNELMPHPVYAWMNWAQILSPDREAFAALLPLLDEAHALAGEKFARKMKAGTPRKPR